MCWRQTAGLNEPDRCALELKVQACARLASCVLPSVFQDESKGCWLFLAYCRTCDALLLDQSTWTAPQGKDYSYGMTSMNYFFPSIAFSTARSNSLSTLFSLSGQRRSCIHAQNLFSIYLCHPFECVFKFFGGPLI